jgi:YHS domain-containing protein
MIQNLKNGVAVQGYDVVSFFNGTPEKGLLKNVVAHNGARYLFSSELNKVKFKASPEKYIPQYGGFCAYAMAEGKEVIPNPESWKIRDGKLYFFTRMFFGIIDAKRQWAKDPAGKLYLADEAWNKMNA